MELIILLLSSVVISRFADKRSPVITVAQVVLFIFLLATYPFITDDELIVSLLLKVMDKFDYENIHTAFLSSASIYGVGISAFVILESSSIFVTLVASVISAVKAFNQIVKAASKYARKISSKLGATVRLSFANNVSQTSEKSFDLNKSESYLELCQLRN